MANALSARQLWGFSCRAIQTASAHCNRRHLPQKSVVTVFRSLCVSPSTNAQKVSIHVYHQTGLVMYHQTVVDRKDARMLGMKIMASLEIFNLFIFTF